MRVIALVIALSGCTCERPRHARDEAPRTSTEAFPDLPRATRDELPRATPMLTIRVHEDGFEVDNRALLATWPPGDRARVEEALGAPPQLHREVEADGDALELDSLSAALRQAREIESLRARGQGVSIAYALRVAPRAPWRRVEQALWSAGRVGWSEPRFVLRTHDGRDVLLALPRTDRALSADEQRRVQREIEVALGELSEPRDEMRTADETAAPEPTPLALTIDADRAVHVAVNDDILHASCTRVGAAPELPTVRPREAHVDVEALARCVDSAQASALALIEPALLVVAAAPTLPAGEVITALEALASRGELSLAASGH